MVISVIISLFGLFSLAWYSLIRQKKTISIRKVFGATPSQIIALFIKRTVLMTSLSFIVAATASAYFLHRWLENYTYRIGIPVYVFILSYLSLVLLISLITYLISRKESTRNPVDNLRYE